MTVRGRATPATGLALTLLAACSSDEVAPTTPSTTVAAALTTNDFKLMAQSTLGRSFSDLDYECVEPVSTVAGTAFTCQGENDGRVLIFTAVIKPDGTVTVTIDN